MASYPAELFAAAVRSTALSVVFNAARLIAWVFPIIAGLMIHTLGGVAHAALILGSVYFIGLIVPWFLPETRARVALSKAKGLRGLTPLGPLGPSGVKPRSPWP